MAGGTGDIALRMLDYARENYADRKTSVLVSDINEGMLKEGRKRARKTMYHGSEYISRLSSSYRILISAKSFPACLPASQCSTIRLRNIP